MDDLQAADYRLPPNADVNEFKGFKMTLPPSCGATTPMQLAVTMSHLKVILPQAFCNLIGSFEISESSTEAHCPAIWSTALLCCIHTKCAFLERVLTPMCMPLQAVREAYNAGVEMALIVEDDMDVLRWPGQKLLRTAPTHWGILLLYMMGARAEEIYK